MNYFTAKIVVVCMVAKCPIDDFLHVLNKILKCTISETNKHINIQFGKCTHIYE